MEKSIEDIWAKGFMNSEELIAPKVINLYNQKSKLLIEKIKKTYELDMKMVLPLTFILGIGLSFFGHFILAIYSVIILLLLNRFNIKLIQPLINIQITTNSYDYLTAYRKEIKKIIQISTKLIGFVLPLTIIPGYWLFFRKTERYADIMNTTAPLKLFLILIGTSIVLSILGVFLYKISTKLMYGKYLVKLDDLITDMEELKK